MKYQSITHYLEDLRLALDTFDFWNVGNNIIIVEFHGDRQLVDPSKTINSQQRKIKNFITRIDSFAGRFA